MINLLLRRLRFYVIYLTVSTAVFMSLAWTIHIAYAGMPNSCPVPGHGGPPCNMERCKAMDSNGKKTGVNCSKYCAKQCCLCSTACPKDQNQNSPNDEENLAYQFGG